MVRFAVAGTGRISDWVLQGAILDHRFKAVAVCSRSTERARAFITAHPEVFDSDALVFTSIEDMAACPEIDAVYIGTPNATHLPYTIASLNGGKHVMCEKPLGQSEAEVREMISAARSAGKVLMEAMISTLNPLFRTAREILKEIGPIRHYSSSYCQYSSKYDALKKGVVANSFNPEMGGGALPDIGIYTTYPLVSLFGYPEVVHPDMVYVPSGCGDVNIQGNVSLKYPGMTADLTFSKAVDSYASTEICGENGNLILDQIHIVRKVTFIPHGAPASGRSARPEPVVMAEGLPKDEYFYEFEEFINVIEQGKPCSEINSYETSLLNARLMDAIKVVPAADAGDHIQS